MSVADPHAEFDRRFALRVREAADDLRGRLRSRLEEAQGDLLAALESWTPDLGSTVSDLAGLSTAAAAPPGEPTVELLRVVRAFDRASSQAETLRALLDAATAGGARAAILLTRDGGFVGWASSGFGDPDPFWGERLGAGLGPSWRRLLEGRGVVELSSVEAAGVASRFDLEIPVAAVAVPFVLRDRVAAALYVDRVGENGALGTPRLQLLVHAAAQAIELAALRARAVTPALYSAEEYPGEPLPLWPPDDAPLPPPAREIASDDLEHFEIEEDEEAEERVEPARTGEFAIPSAPFAVNDAADQPVADEWAIDDEAPAAVEAPPAPAEPALRRYQPITNEIPRPALAALSPAAVAPPMATQAVSLSETVALPAPALPPPAVEPDLADDATVMIDRRAPPLLAAATAAAAPAPVEVETEDPNERTANRRTTEVVPPPDLQGPGWAFAGARAPRQTSGDQALHDEARRLARLLVSEIKLYNEEQVEEGRRSRDIYHRLREDIDRSRQIYDERVHETIRGSADYFQQELVRSLAGGDPRALGI